MMDRRVKERLVGATILVALIVLVVPELLSGPKPSTIPPLALGMPDATRTVSVDLATSKQTAQDAGTAAADAAASSPDTSAPDAPPAAPSAPTVTTLRAQESAPSAAPSLETPPPSPRSPDAATRPAAAPVSGTPGAGVGGRHAWAVQLGSFASKANAERLVHQLQASAGSSAYVLSSGSGAGVRYRVRVGPLADRGAAERAVARLKAQGHAATIVTPTSG